MYTLNQQFFISIHCFRRCNCNVILPFIIFIAFTDTHQTIDLCIHQRCQMMNRSIFCTFLPVSVSIEFVFQSHVQHHAFQSDNPRIAHPLYSSEIQVEGMLLKKHDLFVLSWSNSMHHLKSSAEGCWRIIAIFQCDSDYFDIWILQIH